MIREFSKISGRNWLQGRQLLPRLQRYGCEIEGTVLDLGCGSSPFRFLFPRARQYIRIDRFQVDSEVVACDATETGLEAATIDCVLLFQVIGDVADLTALFREVNRVLAPGGKVLVYETTSYPQHDMPHDYWRVLPQGLKWVAERTGLEVESLHYLGGFFTQIGVLWNIYILGTFDRLPILRLFTWLGRVGANLMLAGLDTLIPRPTLASDYLACLVKTESR